jgi:ribosomal protein S18 acetylase RimI-like enzyme
MTRRSFNVGKDRFVVGPWHDDPTTAYVGIAPSRSTLTSRAAVERCVDQLEREGYRGAVTAALRANDAHVFSTAGFDVKERLHVLRHDLRGDVGNRADPRIRRARRRDRPAVLEVDRLAFDSFWTLGPDGLDEALNATTSVRFRVLDDPAVVGYAVCGRAGEIGYLQRLAVHPDHLRRGVASALVADAVLWLRRRRCRLMLVNTQESNRGALALYQHLGFQLETEHLTVLSWSAAE